MTQKLLYQGAEAVIYLEDNPKEVGGWGKEGGKKLIIKNRIKKSYRLPELDKKIRKSRTKKEKKLLEKASKLINAPNPFPLRKWNIIKMPFIQGKKLSEHLDSFDLKKQKQICKKIGQSIAKLHNEDIIHGDLTTSNFILVENENNLPAHLHSQIDKSNFNDKTQNSYESNLSTLIKHKNSSKQSERDKFKIFFIDFGLGFHSKKIEDKAVDLHLLKQALEARHFKNWKELFNSVIEGYKNLEPEKTKKVLERLKAVEKRGRYKHQKH